MKSAARKEVPIKTNKLMLCVFGFLLVFTVAASAADAPNLTFNFQTTNVPGALATFPTAISNTNAIVGQYEDSNEVFHGYILNGSDLTTLDDPNGINTSPQDIQYNGAIVVGNYFNTSTQEERGFLYTNGEFSDISGSGPPGAVSSEAEGINDNGAIVGYYTDSHGSTHGYLLQGTTYTYPLDVPGATRTGANDINNAGYVVLGWVNSSGANEGAICHIPCTTYKIINVPGAGPLGSSANNIDNEGDITFAWYEGTSNLQHSALFHGGRFYKFENSKLYQSYAYGINDENTFVGGYQRAYGEFWSGFTATFQ